MDEPEVQALLAYCDGLEDEVVEFKFEKEKNSGSLDFLYYYLIHDIFSKKHYFDFGSSNENQGKDLNGGLSLWKESFGASTIIQDFYEIETANYEQLKTAVI